MVSHNINGRKTGLLHQLHNNGEYVIEKTTFTVPVVSHNSAAVESVHNASDSGKYNLTSVCTPHTRHGLTEMSVSCVEHIDSHTA